MTWYISKHGVKEGPYSDEQMGGFIADGYLKPNDLVWQLGLVTWRPVGKTPELLSRPSTPTAGRLPMARHKPATQEAPQTAEAIQTEAPRASGSRLWHAALHKARGKSYFGRHWYGEMSLPISYWVNGSLPTIIMVLAILLIPWDRFVSESPKIYSAVVIAMWLIAALVSGWQLVGIWRSANNYLKQGNRKLWGKLAKVAVVLALINAVVEIVFVAVPQITEFAKIATGNDPIGTYQLRVLRDATELEVSGAIVFGLTKDVIRALDAHPAIRIIHLNSQGGRVGEARKLRDAITTRKLATFTSSGCFSACTLAYAAGQRRLISKGGSLGFHQYSFPGTTQTAFQPEYEKDKRDWLARGFDRSFVDRAFTTPNTDLWKPSHRELFAARVVTGYPGDNEVAISGLQPKVLENMEGELSKNPLVAALKRYELDAYNRLISELETGLKAGRSEAELRQKIFPVAQSVYKQRLPYASDTVLFSVTDLLLEQMNVIYSADPALCYQFLFNDRQSPAFDTTKYFSKELMQRELSVMAEVVRTAAAQAHRRPPQKDQIEAPLKSVFAGLAQRHGDDIRMLANPSLGKTDTAKMCTITYDLYQTIRGLPEQESGSLLRFMFANAK